MRLKAAVIGLGIGRAHADRLAKMDGVDVAAVADLNEERARQVAAKCDARPYADGSELIESEALDFVSVCTNPATHLDLTRRAAAKGVHVICEKPMAPSLEACDGMIQACADAGVKLMIAHKKRFESAYRFIKEQAAGEFGPIRWVTVKYALGRVAKPWFWREDDGGGPLRENTVHIMDMMRFLLGDVERVYAEGGNMFNPEWPEQIDVAAVTLRFRSGAIAALGVGQASEWGFATEFVSLSHENAVVELGGKFDSPFSLRYVLKSDPENIIEKSFEDFDPFHAELAHFADCVREDREPLIPGEEGRASVALCEAVKKSARTGEIVVL